MVGPPRSVSPGASASQQAPRSGPFAFARALRYLTLLEHDAIPSGVFVGGGISALIVGYVGYQVSAHWGSLVLVSAGVMGAATGYAVMILAIWARNNRIDERFPFWPCLQLAVILGIAAYLSQFVFEYVDIIRELEYEGYQNVLARVGFDTYLQAKAQLGTSITLITRYHPQDGPSMPIHGSIMYWLWIAEALAAGYGGYWGCARALAPRLAKLAASSAPESGAAAEPTRTTLPRAASFTLPREEIDALPQPPSRVPAADNISPGWQVYRGDARFPVTLAYPPGWLVDGLHADTNYLSLRTPDQLRMLFLHPMSWDEAAELAQQPNEPVLIAAAGTTFAVNVRQGTDAQQLWYFAHGVCHGTMWLIGFGFPAADRAASTNEIFVPFMESLKIHSAPQSAATVTGVQPKPVVSLADACQSASVVSAERAPFDATGTYTRREALLCEIHEYQLRYADGEFVEDEAWSAWLEAHPLFRDFWHWYGRLGTEVEDGTAGSEWAQETYLIEAYLRQSAS